MRYLGRIGISRAVYLGESSLQVQFVSDWTGMYHQVYLGRRLVGETAAPSERTVTALVAPADVAEWLQVVAVDADELGLDRGERLPRRPYNRVRLAWDTTGWTDARLIEVAAGTAPGGAVVATNVIERVLFDVNRRYELDTPALRGPGRREWNFEVAGRDETPPTGNRGTPTAISAEILSPPPDLAIANPDAPRFTGAVVSQALVLEFDYVP